MNVIKIADYRIAISTVATLEKDEAYDQLEWDSYLVREGLDVLRAYQSIRDDVVRSRLRTLILEAAHLDNEPGGD